MRKTLLSALFLITITPALAAVDCVQCHKRITPIVVADWQVSKHAENGVGCDVCHGSDHTSPATVAKVQFPTPDTCAQCHEDKVEQFKKGKHALAWASMNAMPTAHMQPAALMEGMKGCGGCHNLGLKSTEQIAALSKDGRGFGLGSCDACHTRHAFSAEEARQPQACQTCHMGFDHPQWEMFSSSKHGVRSALKQLGKLPQSAAAPTCQECHMSEGSHEVHTAWGFLAVRLPLPEDPEWKADQITILQALGVLDPDGKPTARLDVVKTANMARLTAEAWQAERDKMIKVCRQCHSGNFAMDELKKSDDMIRKADHLMAAAIREVAGLYADGILIRPDSYANAFPDLLAFHDAPTVVEQKLFVMFLEHRMRTFQGAFHSSPDYALWYGWSAMQMDLTEIRELAASMREEHGE